MQLMMSSRYYLGLFHSSCQNNATSTQRPLIFDDISNSAVGTVASAAAEADNRRAQGAAVAIAVQQQPFPHLEIKGSTRELVGLKVTCAPLR
jgi:hypothetical protein